MAINAVVVDSREPAWVQALTFGNVPVAVAPLDAGDVWVATDDAVLLVIERKSSTDLLGTIAGGRFLPQMAEMLKITRWAYLAIGGILYPGPENKTVNDRGVTGWSWTALQGALLSAQELGVQIVQYARDEDFAGLIKWLAERPHEPTHLVAPTKTPNFYTTAERILTAFDGIGIEKAAALLSYCGSVGQALAFLTDMTTNNGHVAGIGDVTKQKVRQMLGLENWAELALISTEGKLIEQGRLAG